MDEVVAQIAPGSNALRYFHYDANGNCILQTDGSGALTEQYYYDAFGLPYFYNAAGTNLSYSASGNRFLFTGREWLSELKLYDYRNRIYQPELGRFLQPDPVHFAAGDYNLYRYCYNDPVNRSDPMGLLSFSGTLEKQRLMPVLGSNIRKWITFEKIPINFTTSGNHMDKNAANHVVDAASALLAGKKGHTIVEGKVTEGRSDTGGKVLNANLNVDYWTKDVRYDALEREHTFGVEGGGSKTKGILERGGMWDRFKGEWANGVSDFFAQPRVQSSLAEHIRQMRREHKATWDAEWGHHNVPW